MMRTRCRCGETFKVPADMVGAMTRCPGCGLQMLVRDNVGEASASSRVWVLLLGCGCLTLLALAAGGGGAWLYFSSFSSDPPEGGAAASGKNKNMDPVAVKFFVPHKKGDKREIKVAFEKTQRAQLTAPDNNMPADQLYDRSQTSAATLQAIVQTVKVDDKGEAVNFKVTINGYSARSASPERPIPAGTIIYFGTLGGWPFLYIQPKNTYELLPGERESVWQLVRNGADIWPESELDRLCGTTAKQVVGGTWQADSNALSKFWEGPKIQTPSAWGIGRLANVVKEGDVTYLDVEAILEKKWTELDKLNDFKTKVTIQLRLPSDFSTGPVRRVVRYEYHEVKKAQNWGGNQRLVYIEDSTQTVTTDFTYLGNAPIDEEPYMPKGGSKTPIGKGPTGK
jgi:hypothetical protein